MSQRQELLRAELWEEVHKHDFEKQKEALQKLKNEIDLLPDDSEERKIKQAKYDNDYAAAEDFFMKFHESSIGY